MYLFIYCFFFLNDSTGVNGYDQEPEAQTGAGAGVGDPAQIVSKALLCFNNKYVSATLQYSPIISPHVCQDWVTDIFKIREKYSLQF